MACFVKIQRLIILANECFFNSWSCKQVVYSLKVCY